MKNEERSTHKHKQSVVWIGTVQQTNIAKEIPLIDLITISNVRALLSTPASLAARDKDSPLARTRAPKWTDKRELLRRTSTARPRPRPNYSSDPYADASTDRAGYSRWFGRSGSGGFRISLTGAVEVAVAESERGVDEAADVRLVHPPHAQPHRRHPVPAAQRHRRVLRRRRRRHGALGPPLTSGSARRRWIGPAASPRSLELGSGSGTLFSLGFCVWFLFLVWLF